jgi:heterodisulfide reductase subunit D
MGAIPGLQVVEMPRNREHSACCGKHAMRYPRLGGAINLSRVAEAGETGASALVTCCTTCENNFRIGISDAGSSLEVLDLMDLAAESLGLPRLSVSKIGKLLRK